MHPWRTLRSRSLHLGTQQSLKDPVQQLSPFSDLSCHTLRGSAENVPTPPTPTPAPQRLHYDIQVLTLKPHTATLTHPGATLRGLLQRSRPPSGGRSGPQLPRTPKKVLSLAPQGTPCVTETLNSSPNIPGLSPDGRPHTQRAPLLWKQSSAPPPHLPATPRLTPSQTPCPQEHLRGVH